MPAAQQILLAYGGPAGPTYSAEATAFFARLSTPPDAARKTVYDNFFISLVAAGVYSKLDALYLFAANDSATALTSLISATYNASLVNAPTFTTDRGFTGATTKRIESNFNPTTASSPKYTQNDATLFAWNLTAAASAGPIAGAPSYGATYIYERFTADDKAYWRINSAADDNNQAVLNGGVGMFLGTRRSSSATQAYRDGVSVGTGSQTSVTLPNGFLSFLAGDAATIASTSQVAAGGFGSQLSTAEQLALYNAMITYMAAVGAGYSAEATAFFARLGTQPSSARKTLYDTFIRALVSAGVWAKLDALYLFAANDSATAITSLISATFNATLVNAPTFTTDRGFTGALTKHINTNFNPTTASSPKYTQNSANVFLWSRTSTGNDQAAVGYIGAPNEGNRLTIWPRYIDNLSYYRINSAASYIEPANTDGTGFYLASRTTSALEEAYKNGVSQGTNVTSSAVVNNNNIGFMTGYNGSDSWPGEMAVAGIGGGLDGTEQLALYNATLAYLQGVGAA